MTDQPHSEQTVPPGLRVLIIEDMWLVAEDLSLLLEELGCHVAGPAGRLEHGLRIAQEEALDGALLDVNLGSDTSFPIAMALQERQIPFVFLTGYDDLSDAFSAELPEAPRLSKPVNPRDLIAAVAGFAAK